MRDSYRSLRLWLSTAFRAAPGLVVLQCAMQTAQSALAPIQTLGVSWLVNGMASHSSLLPAVALIIASLASSALTEALFEPLSSTVYERVHCRLHKEMLELTGSIPGIGIHENVETANRLELLRGETWRLSRSARTLMLVLGTLVSTATVLWLLISIDPVLTLLPALGLVRVWLAGRGGKLLWSAVERTTPHTRLVNRLLDISGDPRHGVEVRVFGLRRALAERVRAHLALVRAEQTRANWRGAALEVSANVVFAAAYIAAIAVTVVRARGGALSPGDVALVILLSAQVDHATSSLATSTRELGQLLNLFSGYVWLRDHAAELRRRAEGAKDAPAQLRSGIDVRGVKFRYEGSERWILDGIDLRIPAGSTIAVVGDNGAGKTTLAKLLLRLYEPSEGAIVIDGEDLSAIDAGQWWSRTAAGFQDFCRFEFTALENVGLGDLPKAQDERAVRSALRRGDAEIVVDNLPNGLRTQLGTRFGEGVNPSLGQWQRLALARAFMRSAPLLLLLDEPTAALDPEAEDALFARFAAASRGVSMSGGITVLVSHRFSTVRMADIIIVLSDGRIQEVGDHEGLMRRRGRYSELFDLQARAYR
ncbi:ABC transporter ATP-binding protein/permease [Streptomyces canus]|uniref:ABC transporter ATP-binding protein n=1 Tax=Streptomyces canus TaxID=58343 RepID=UPI0030E20B8C